MGVGVDAAFFKACGDRIKIAHGLFFLSGSRLYVGLCVCGIIYDADFVNFADLGNCPGLRLFVKGIVANVESKGHLRQVAALHGSIYRPRLLCVRQFCRHFKPLFCDGQGKGFRASRKGYLSAVVIGNQYNVVKVKPAQCVRGDNLFNAAYIGRLIEYHGNARQGQGLFSRPDFITTGLLLILHLCLPLFLQVGMRPPFQRKHSSGIANACRRPRRAVMPINAALRLRS